MLLFDYSPRPVGSLPLFTFRRLSRGKERDPTHRLHRLLHDQPNRWQTSFEWREMMQGHVTLRGNAYSRIVTTHRFGTEGAKIAP